MVEVQSACDDNDDQEGDRLKSGLRPPQQKSTDSSTVKATGIDIHALIKN